MLLQNLLGPQSESCSHAMGTMAAPLVRADVQVVQIEPVVDDHEVAVPVRRKGHAEVAAGLARTFLPVQV